MKIPCPKCGADISYDPGSGKVYCEYCGSYSEISELETAQYDNQKTEANYNESNIYDEFHCSSCGAKLVTDKTTTITRCVFCGSQQLIKQRLTGKFEPKKIIPFKINKESFLNIYRTFVSKKILAPDEFRNNPIITETRGLYVPFYLYNYAIKTYARGVGTYRSDNNTYYMWFENEITQDALIPVDGSTRLDDSIMSSLEPYNTNEIKDFNPAYITGFQAECTDETEESLNAKAENRAVMHSKRQVKKITGRYTQQGGLVVSDLKKLNEQEYVLFPVWFVNTNFDNKKYSYAVNGQTGKVVGEIPLSKAKFVPLMTVLVIIATILTIGYLSLAFADSYDDNDDDSSGGVLALIWGGIVIAPYVGIKRRYKNVSHVLENPIKTLNEQTFKNVKFKSKKDYEKAFPNDNLKELNFQKYIDGKYVCKIDMKQMVSDVRTSGSKNYTINKDEL